MFSGLDTNKIFKSSLLFPIVIFIISFILYITTLAPVYLPPDGAEFALCIQSVGICHPTGFFLYVLLGKLFTFLIPFGTLIYKINLLSAFYASGTMVFSYLSLIKMGSDKKISFLVVLVYAFSAGMWEFANSADVFTFGTCLLSITLYTVITKRFYLSFIFLGLLTSHFPNSVILLPVLFWYWSKSDEKFIPLFVQGCGVFFFSLLLPLLLLFLRMQQQPFIDWGHVATLGDFYNYLTRKEFGGMFLIQTPQNSFSFTNFFLQLLRYCEAMFVQFGFILPLIALYGVIRAKVYKDSTVVFLFYSFILLAVFNIFSLSSINPEVGINFQFDKFYLSSFTILILLLGIGIGKIKGAVVRNYTLPGLLLVILLIQLSLNFTSHNYRNDFFSQQMVNDALSELPANAIAITLTNQNFFETWYEQVNDNKFSNITLLYLPNTSNTDYEKYHPELFSHSEDIGQAPFVRTTDPAIQAVFNIIAQNPKRPVFIWQGVYENGRFVADSAFAKRLTPFGLWWRVDSHHANSSASIKNSEKLLTGINFATINTHDLNSVQRLEDLQTYTQSLQATSFALVSIGNYDEALRLLYTANSLITTTDVQKEIVAINEIKELEPQTKAFTKAKDQNSLLELAQDYYSLRDFSKCIEIFKDILTFDKQDPQMYSNLASMYALENDESNALKYYNKALQIDPSLPSAIEWKSRLESGE
jgi:tetratricopeptide (TPR) repeat protein